MDYLPHPGTQHRKVSVPMLFGCPSYDHGSFEEFPRRRGWDLAKLLTGDLDGKDCSAAASFTQQWLYFGIISTVFAATGTPFHLSDFILVHQDSTIMSYLIRFVRRDHQRIHTVLQFLDRQDILITSDQLEINGNPLHLLVTGKPLSAALQNLENKEQSAPEEQRRLNFSKINSAMDLALRVIRIFAEAISKAIADGRHDLRDLLRAILPGEIELSVILLAETIKYKLVDLYGSRLDLQRHSSKWLFDTMEDLGWCRAFLSELLHQYGMRIVYYGYLQNSIPRHGLDHSKCKGRRCVANNIDKNTYVTRHTSPDLIFRPPWWHPQSAVIRRVHYAWYRKEDSACNCNHLVPDLAKIRDILRRGGIPLISLRTPGIFDSKARLLSVELDVVEWEPTILFTAISHVWSDGLGNPKSNSLPLCQFQELRNILLAARADVRDAKSLIFNGLRNILTMYATSPSKLYFWMDTLCVPLDPDTRKLAIRNLTKCFKNASLVLARDSFMMFCSCSSQEVDILYRLNLSTWTRRMWTFQEAAVAQRIYVQLSDGYERLIHLPKHFNNWVGQNNTVVTLTDRKNLLLFSLTVASFQLELIPPPKRFFAVALALSMRTTSWNEDEAISVATLLGRGLDEVTTVDEDKKWLTLLPTLADLLSQNVIFMRSSKMSTPGYRWAPSTFLDLDRETELGYLTRNENSNDPSLQISERGVLVSFPGLLFGAIPKPLTSLFCFESNATKERFWGTTGIQPDGKTYWDIENIPAGTGYGLVMQRTPDIRSNTRAVLLADCSVEDEVIYGTYVSVLSIERLLQQSNSPPYVTERKIWEMITSMPNFKEKCWFPDIEKEFPRQTWCVS